MNIQGRLIFNNPAASIYAALDWHLHIIKDLIDHDDQGDGQQTNKETNKQGQDE